MVTYPINLSLRSSFQTSKPSIQTQQQMILHESTSKTLTPLLCVLLDTSFLAQLKLKYCLTLQLHLIDCSKEGPAYFFSLEISIF